MFDRIQSFNLSPENGSLECFSCETFTDSLGNVVKGPLRKYLITAPDQPDLFRTLSDVVAQAEQSSLIAAIADKSQEALVIT